MSRKRNSEANGPLRRLTHISREVTYYKSSSEGM